MATGNSTDPTDAFRCTRDHKSSDDNRHAELLHNLMVYTCAALTVLHCRGLQVDCCVKGACVEGSCTCIDGFHGARCALPPGTNIQCGSWTGYQQCEQRPAITQLACQRPSVDAFALITCP